MAIYSGRIQTRSPFSFSRNAGTHILTATCKVWIWDGHITSDKPASPNYTITKNALTATSTSILFEISQLIRDEFNHNRDAYNDAVTTYSDTLWVEIEVTSTDTGVAPPASSNIYLAVDGYGYFAEGVNYAGTDFFTSVINNPLDEIIRLGLYAGYNTTDGVDTVKYYNGAVLVETDDLSAANTSSYSYDKNQYIDVVQGVDNRFEARVVADSGTYIINTCFNAFAPSDVESTIDTIKLYNGATLLDTITVNNICEPKFTYNTIKFYDRSGLLQQVYMYKISKEKIKVKRDKYNSIMGHPYSIEKHQVKDYNVTANESISLSSGFVGEEQNDVFKQILLSEFVWVDDKPARITTSSLDYKKHINDKLINYTLEFDYANDVINTVY